MGDDACGSVEDMAHDTDEDSSGPYRIDCSLGDLDVTVKGDKPAWVSDEFERIWTARLRESEQMKDALRDADLGLR